MVVDAKRGWACSSAVFRLFFRPRSPASDAGLTFYVAMCHIIYIKIKRNGGRCRLTSNWITECRMHVDCGIHFHWARLWIVLMNFVVPSWKPNQLDNPSFLFSFFYSFEKRNILAKISSTWLKRNWLENDLIHQLISNTRPFDNFLFLVFSFFFFKFVRNLLSTEVS